jgi:lysophospholipase L1-like esterase
MVLAAKLTLGPLLLWQGRRLRRTALRLPEAAGPRDGAVVAPSAQPLRILVVGDSSAAGVGVDSQAQALAAQVARDVAMTTGRTVHWQLLARSGVNTAEALALVQASELQAADVVVTALGVNDVTSQVGPGRFGQDYARLLNHLCAATGARLAVLNGLPPLHVLPAAPQPLRWYLGLCAQRLDAVVQSLCQPAAQRRFVSLQWALPQHMAIDRFHPGLSQYAQWAHMVAAEVVSLLQGGAAAAAPSPALCPAE